MRNDFKGKGTAMKCFLTSYCLNEEGELNPANGFVDELKSALNPRICGLFVASAPEEYDDADMLDEAKEYAETFAIPEFAAFNIFMTEDDIRPED